MRRVKWKEEEDGGREGERTTGSFFVDFVLFLPLSLLRLLRRLPHFSAMNWSARDREAQLPNFVKLHAVVQSTSLLFAGG
jgi:hypothetical protein